MPNYYRDFQSIFSSTGRLYGAVLYILYDYKPTKFKDTCKNLKYSAEDHISQIFEELNENMINDLEYIHNRNIMYVIDDIDNKLTLCHDSILKEKNIIEVINDLRPTSNILEQINEEGNKYHEILYEICYDSDYFNSNDDPIERYLYQLINHIYYPFLEYFEDLCKKHDIDLFAIQRKIGKYIIEDDEFEDYKTEYSNLSLPKQIVSETNDYNNIEIEATEKDKYNYDFIREKLEPFISGGSASVYKSVIEQQVLPKDAATLRMKKRNKADIYRFANCFGITISKINKVFDEQILSKNKPDSFINPFFHVLKEINPDFNPPKK